MLFLQLSVRECSIIIQIDDIKVTFARNLAKKLSPLFYYLILLFQLSVANPENFAPSLHFVRKFYKLSAYAYGIFKV